MKWYCNEFIRALPIVFVCLLSLGNIEMPHKIYRGYQSLSAVKVKQEHRPCYHYQPEKNCISDTNGAIYYNGFYHLFYQYNPYGAIWTNFTVWGHSISKDLISWKTLKPAIRPTKAFDKHGCWSGSTMILPGNKPIILYTGIDETHTQVQNYALPANSSDPYLEEWIKPDDNPFLVAGLRVNKINFRDPSTAWMGPDGQWRFLIGSSKNSRGIAYLYKSKDFINWVQDENPFHSKEKTGNWEGLDFFPISLKGKEGLENWMINGENVKFVLKVSLDPTRYDYYTIGKYLPKTDRYILDNTALDGSKGLRYDYGNFYASKSLFDPRKKRRIIWGFSNESDTRMDIVEKGWNGTLPIPRRIWLDPNGKQLLAWPIEEVESLRGHEVQLRNKKIKKGEVLEIEGITAAQADVEVVFFFPSLSKAERFDPSWDHIDAQELCSRKGSAVQGGLGPFGLLTLASKKLEEHTPVFFRIFEDKNKHRILLCSDASSSSLKKGLYKPSFAGFVDVDLSKKMLSLRSLIDHSIVESFGAGGKVCITSRVYPTLAVFNNAHLYAFNNGSQTVTIKKLEAWSMNKPKEMN